LQLRLLLWRRRLRLLRRGFWRFGQAGGQLHRQAALRVLQQREREQQQCMQNERRHHRQRQQADLPIL
jgi:hypothetical protein